MRLEQAYPELSFRWRSRNWWARLARLPAECVHLERGGPWMATLIPDTLYLRGKASHRSRPVRPEVSLCLSCLRQQLRKRLLELCRPGGRLRARQKRLPQYFFIGTARNSRRRFAAGDGRGHWPPPRAADGPM